MQASDPDAGAYGEVEYSFSSTTSSQYGSIFGLNPVTGEIFVKGPINYEDTTLYQLSIQAKDKGESPVPTRATVRIHVRDVNDHAPSISVNTLTTSGVAEIQENAAAETFVAYVTVIDPDQDMNGQFSCDLQDSSGAFNLKKESSRNNYKIITAKPLDREEQENYNVVILCSDFGSPKLSENKPLVIKVLDENDHQPAFTENTYYATLVENNTVGAYIIRVEARDEDSGKNAKITYSVQNTDPQERSLVRVDPLTGVIQANTKFDYEMASNYEFLLMAEDGGEPAKSDSAILRLDIRDMNDEYPVFTEQFFVFNALEGTEPETIIGTVSATDRDKYPFNKINYYLDHRSPGYNNFHIDELTGQMKVTAPSIDRESVNGQYNLTVIANNDGFPSIQSTVQVIVVIEDVNDNAPEILFPNKDNDTVRISNQVAVGEKVTQVLASDRDAGLNAKLSYVITSGNELGWFTVDETTGFVEVAEDLESIDHRFFSLVITVSDQGKPQPLASICDLKIEVDSSLAASIKGNKSSAFADNLMILLGILAALLLVIFLIVVTVIFIRRHKKRAVPKDQQYNVRVETDKALNGATKYTSEDEHNSTKSDTSIDTVKDSKTALKKEVQFQYDSDVPYSKPPSESDIHPVQIQIKVSVYQYRLCVHFTK